MNDKTIRHSFHTSYHFELSGEKKTYHVLFQLNDNDLKITCSCGARNITNYCWHAQYIIAGKTSRITGGDTKRHKELLAELDKTEPGRKMRKISQRKFEGDATCRRCASNRIVKTKYSLIARLWSLLKENKHTYFCKDCKWTW